MQKKDEILEYINFNRCGHRIRIYICGCGKHRIGNNIYGGKQITP